MVLNAYKSMRLDGRHPRALKEPACRVLLSIIFETAWLSPRSRITGKRGPVTPAYKKGSKRIRGTTYRLENPSSVPGKMMEHILLEDIADHVRNERVIPDNPTCDPTQ